MLEVQSDVRRRLEDALGVPAFARPPANAPREFVTVEREGGAAENAIVDRAGVGVYAWAGTEAGAAALASRVRSAMRALPFEGGYATVEEEAVSSDPDPKTRSPRWYLSYTLRVFEPIRKKE